jgi:hypothetical protein
MNTVDGDAKAAQLVGQRFGHMNQGDIAGTTTQVASSAGIAAADIDDAAPTLRFQKRYGGSGAP